MRNVVGAALIAVLLSIQPVQALSMRDQLADHTVAAGAVLGCVTASALNLVVFRKEASPLITCGIAAAGGSFMMWKLSASQSDTPVDRMKNIHELNSTPVTPAENEHSGSAR